MEWLIKALIGHLHEWGKWENKAKNRQSINAETGKTLYSFRQYFQQRECKICGKIEQKDIQYDPGAGL